MAPRDEDRAEEAAERAAEAAERAERAAERAEEAVEEDTPYDAYSNSTTELKLKVAQAEA